MKDVLFPNKLRGHAVMLSSFITGNLYFVLLTAGFSAALGLIFGIVTAPIGYLAGAGTIFIVRRAVNIEFGFLRKEASRQGIELRELPDIEEGDLLKIGKKLYLDRDSWKAVLISLAKFPIGLASLTFISMYLSLSLTLISSPLLHSFVDLNVYGNTLNTPTELSLAVVTGAVVYMIGANLTEKASKIYLEINSNI